MCGICGIIRFDNSLVDKSVLEEMMDSMNNRGPDDRGTFFDNNVGLGFVRLSIIDLSSAAHQPMISNDGRFIMVYNGEIYNYIEIKNELINKGHIFRSKSDSEVLLNSYIEWGESCLDKFNGMWAFVIYDRVEKRVFGSRDRYGIKPFYYLQTNDFFAFASEITPLLKIFPSNPVPDYQTIFDYLVFNRTDQTEQTFFDKIKKLQHGSYIRINSYEIKINKWYSLKEKVLVNSGFSSFDQYKDVFSSSIGLRLRSDVPVGVCLSGGLDSSSIVSVLLHDYNLTDLNTFSAIYNESNLDESGYIGEFRSHLKNMFFTFPTHETLYNDLNKFIKAQVEPVPSTGPYAQFKVMELAKGKVVVTLDGQGADEELAGYHYFFGFYFKELFKAGQLGKLNNELYNYLITHLSFYGIKTFLFFLLPENFMTSLRIKQRSYLKKEYINNYKNTNQITHNIYMADNLQEALLSHFEFKLEHLLKWEDRNSMWFSLEARVPFLDYRLVEKTLATPSNLIINKGNTKYILRRSLKDILPDKIKDRKDKIGFDTPESIWFKNDSWIDLIREIIESRSFSNRKIIDPLLAKKLYDRHLHNKIDISKDIWKWINLELWFREYID